MTAPTPWFEVKNYGPVRDARLELTPLHALIGPNDSGKSTLLRALRAAIQFACGGFERSDDGAVKPFDPGVDRNPEFEFTLALGETTTAFRVKQIKYTFPGGSREDAFYRHVITQDAAARGWKTASSEVLDLRFRLLDQQKNEFLDPPSPQFKRGPSTEPWKSLLRGARLLRLDPDAMREPALPIPDSTAAITFDERGRGLPGIYDRILNRSPRGFLAITDRARELFPTIRDLKLSVNAQHAKQLEVELASGQLVPAAFVSEGLLYFLAFAAMQHLEPAAILLVEEPENGLHPARIVDVMRVLREVSRTTQVLVATHSPLVINELTADEVTVVTRPSLEKGTQLTPMRKAFNFEERSKVYALGELWLAYADGNVEAPLLEKPADSANRKP